MPGDPFPQHYLICAIVWVRDSDNNEQSGAHVLFYSSPHKVHKVHKEITILIILCELCEHCERLRRASVTLGGLSAPLKDRPDSAQGLSRREALLDLGIKSRIHWFRGCIKSSL